MKIISLHTKKLLRIATLSCSTAGLQTKVNIQICEVKRINKKISNQNLAKAIAIKNLAQEIFYFQDVNRAEESELEHFCISQLKRMSKRMGISVQVVATNLRNSIEQVTRGIEYLDPSLIAANLDCVVITDFEDGDLSVGGSATPLSAVFAEAIHPLPFDSSFHFLSIEPSSIKFNNKQKATAHVANDLNLLVEKISKTGDPEKGIASQEISRSLFEQLKSSELNVQFVENIDDQMSMLSANDKAATLKELTSLIVKKISLEDLKTSAKAGVILFGDDQVVTPLTKRLKYLNPNCRVLSGDELNWPDDTYVGGTLAVLAALKVWGIPSNIPKLTKAKRAVSLGKIVEL